MDQNTMILLYCGALVVFFAVAIGVAHRQKRKDNQDE